MSQVRFSIGIPKVGSAARSAEAGEKVESIRPRVGSAARDAEQRRAFEPAPAERAARVGMRASGGRVVTAAEMQAAEMRARVGVPVSAAPAADIQRSSGPAVPQHILPEQQQAFVSTAKVPDPVVKESTLSPLEAAAGQIKSLVQSLFSSGVSSSKS